MGIEYKLRFEHEDHAAVLGTLSRVSGASKVVEGSVSLEFRDKPGAEGSMPDATLVVEPDGAYFCHHGGHGREILGRVVAALVAELGRVTVEDYE